MKKSMQIAVLIPSCNQALMTEKVIRDFRTHLPEARIYVYGDHTTDDTVLRAQLAGATVKQDEWRGKAYAIQRMFSDIEADFYILMDGDDAYEVATVRSMLRCAITGNVDLVNGVRVCNEGSIKNHFAQLFFGNRIQDMHSAFKVLSKRFVKSFPGFTTRSAIEMKLTLHALALDMPVSNIDISYRGTLDNSWKVFSNLFFLYRMTVDRMSLRRKEFKRLIYLQHPIDNYEGYKVFEERKTFQSQVTWHEDEHIT
jgi:glycosyltransferase involved in cell wall biosynthesis